MVKIPHLASFAAMVGPTPVKYSQELLSTVLFKIKNLIITGKYIRCDLSHHSGNFAQIITKLLVACEYLFVKDGVQLDESYYNVYGGF
ncbi:hypothetical protein, partial [Legionella pneumophila]|uniref:hypothetical protein n=1 Tax=Legionella pneumophila TaxID=446 RepID=UPI0021C650F1